MGIFGVKLPLNGINYFETAHNCPNFPRRSAAPANFCPGFPILFNCFFLTWSSGGMLRLTGVKSLFQPKVPSDVADVFGTTKKAILLYLRQFGVTSRRPHFSVAKGVYPYFLYPQTFLYLFYYSRGKG